MTRTLKPRPWITPSDAEQFDGTFAYNGIELVIPGVERDEQGVLWQPMPDAPDEGVVRWKDMHTGRQKQAMLEGRCQVCGTVLPERPLTWLIPAIEVRLYKVNGRPFHTTTPPTCETCISIALEHCPNLVRMAPTKLLVRNWRPVAVFGDLMTPDHRHVQGEVSLLDAPMLRRIMARHLVVEIYDYRRAR